jgi:GYD domain
MAEKLGVTIRGFYYTVGHHDMVIILEGSDEAVTTALLKAGSLGNVRSETSGSVPRWRAAERARQTSEEDYKAGASALTDVLDADRELLTAQDDLAGTQTRRARPLRCSGHSAEDGNDNGGEIGFTVAT